MEGQYIRIIFGLKLKQIRNERGLSLFKLSKLTDLSKSYLNEIEKGKKHPKSDKILKLAKVLEVPYDQMVSLKLDKNLAPVGQILQSNLLQEIPLDLFGIDSRDLIDIISDAPLKVNAFISTIIEIGKNYNITKQSFFQGALRSHIEAQENYFEDLELAVEQFRKAYQIIESEIPNPNYLEEVLSEEFDYTVKYTPFNKLEPKLAHLRALFIAHKKTLLLNTLIPNHFLHFVLAKEVGYQFLKIEDRLYAHHFDNSERFETLLNNFYASYFAGALLIPKNNLILELKNWFAKPLFSASEFGAFLLSFNESGELVMQRIANLLPQYFGIKELFYVRMGYEIGSNRFTIDKEIHLQQPQSPHANETSEHYCRRWISIKTMKAMSENPTDEMMVDSQISNYPMHGNSRYWVVSITMTHPFKKNHLRSVSLGIPLKGTKQKITFLNNDSITKMDVGVTCEYCAIKNCKERVTPAIRLEKENHQKDLSHTILNLINSKK